MCLNRLHFCLSAWSLDYEFKHYEFCAGYFPNSPNTSEMFADNNKYR